MDELYRAAAEKPAEHDYRAYDRIWQRVAPELEPYPGLRTSGAEGGSPPAALPEGRQDPCCMGTQAVSDVGVIRGFIEQEERDRQYYARLACSVGDRQTAQALKRLSQSADTHLRRLLAAYYLTVGECARWGRQIAVPPAEGLCAALRRAYHEAVCTGFNYLRAADATGDLCLRKLFRGFGEEEMAGGELLLRLLSRHL